MKWTIVLVALFGHLLRDLGGTTTTQEGTTDIATTDFQETTAVPETTSFVTTTVPETTTFLPTTSVQEETTPTPTSTVPETTTPIETTTVPETTPIPTTTDPETTALPTTTFPETTTPIPTSTVPETTTSIQTSTGPEPTTPIPTTNFSETTTPIPTSTDTEITTSIPTSTAPETTTLIAMTTVPETPITSTEQETTPIPITVPETTTPTDTYTTTPIQTSTASSTTTPVATTTVLETTTPIPPTTLSETTTPIPTTTLSETTTPISTTTLSETTTPIPTTNFSETTTPIPTTNFSETTTSIPTTNFSETTTPISTTNFSETTTPMSTTNFSETTTPIPTTNFSETTTPIPTTNFSETTTPISTTNFSETTTPIPTTTFPETTTPVQTSTDSNTTIPIQTSIASNTTTPIATSTFSETTTPMPTTTFPETTTPTQMSTVPETTTSIPASTTLIPTTVPETTTPVQTSTDSNTTTSIQTSTTSNTTIPIQPSTESNTTSPIPTSTFSETTNSIPASTTLIPTTVPETTTPVQTSTDSNTTTSIQTSTTSNTTIPIQPSTESNTTSPIPTSTFSETTNPIPTTTFPEATTPIQTSTATNTTTPVETSTVQETTTPIPTSTVPEATTPIPTTAVQETTPIPTSTDPETTTSIPTSTVPETTTPIPTTAVPETTQPITMPPTTSSTTAIQCTGSPCQNGGTYSVESGGSCVCTCTTEFTGQYCEHYDTLRAAAAVNPDSESSFLEVVEKVTSTANNTANVDVLKTISDTIQVLVEKAANATWTEQQAKTAGTNLIRSADNILSSLQNHQTQSASTICQQDQNQACTEDKKKTGDVVEGLTNSIVDLGNTVFADEEEGELDLKAENIAVTITKKSTESLSRTNDEDDVLLPTSLVDTLQRERVVLTKIETDKNLYSHAVNQITVSGPVVKIAMATESGKEVSNVDIDDPAVVTLDAKSNLVFTDLDIHEEGSTLTAVQKVSSDGKNSQLLVELNIPVQTNVVLRGRFGELPRTYDRDFEAYVNDKVVEVIAHKSVTFQLYNGELVMMVEQTGLQADGAYIVIQYSDTGSSRRRRSAIKPTMRTRTLAAKVWNPATISWEDNNQVAVSGVSKTGKVQFKSSFFGTFALSEVLIPPTPIDFNRLFLSFHTYLRDSPYVLAINCFLVAMTIVVALFLRRLDKTDKELWRYLPLVDNNDTDPYIYSLSVHTSLRSRRKLSVTPFFILSGKLGHTQPRILSDGNRKNFNPGTVSNFIVSTNVHLGPVTRIKMWHDNLGDSTRWHVDKIVLVDLQDKTRYLFICQKWLALGEDDGRFCRTFEAFTNDTEDISMLDMVSKQKLFDDHLWLSVFKRPIFSRFTRVQRFLCAVAMLFLSMVTSAMFYQDYDSGTQKSRGIEIGPVKLNYRQLYVGIVSSIIIVVPGLMMTLTFRRRRQRGEKPDDESCTGYLNGKKLFPWWFIFIGYFLIICGVGASAFFTFLYSLQWGGATSLNWLMSLFFCTTGSTFLVEPIKIVILSVAVTAVFKKTVQEDIAYVAPVKKENTLGDYISVRPSHPIPEPPDEDTEDIQKRRKELFLKNKLINVGKSLVGKTVFVAIVAIICLHNDVMDSYRLNTLMKTYANETYISSMVNRRTDVWIWFNELFIPSLLPKYYYNGKVMSVYDQRFTRDRANVRIGPINLRQYRVKGSCNDNYLAKHYGLPMECIPEYTTETAEYDIFKEGWKTCTDTKVCIDKSFHPTSSAGGSSVTIDGIFGSYGDRSYIESWSKDQRHASTRKTYLENNDWLDGYSRALVVEVSLYNPNVRLFTRLRVLFEFPTVGDVTATVDASSANLYPYVTVWDYLVLLLQMVFLVTVIVRLCSFCHSVCCSRGKVSCLSVLVFLLEMLLSVCATVVYGVKIDRTIFVIEEIHNNPDSYVSFDLVHLLEDIFRFTISMVLFIRILSLMEPLAVNYNLFLMRATLLTSQKELLAFSIVLAVTVTAFASMFYLLEGPITMDIRSLPRTYMTLFEGLLGLIRSRQLFLSEVGFESFTKQAMFIFYFFTLTLIMMNIAISILSINMSSIKGHKEFRVGPEFDQELNSYLWKILTSCVPRHGTEINTEFGKYERSDTIGEDAQDIGFKLDKMLAVITNTNNADVMLARGMVNRVLGELYSAQSRIRQTEEEVKIVQQELDCLKDKVMKLTSEEVVSEPEKATVTLSIEDSKGKAYLLYKITSKSPTTAEDMGISDVTDSEKTLLTRGMRRLYGKVYKCGSVPDFENRSINIQIRINTEPHPYEDVILAIRSAKTKKWKYIKSVNTCDETCDTSTYLVKGVCEFIPTFITCVSEQKSYVHTIPPSGGEFSLPFEPRSRFFYNQGCVSSQFDVGVKLIPRHPVPVVQITPSGNILCPVRVELPVASDTSPYGPNPEWTVLCSTCDNQWWKAPTQVSVEGTLAIFLAYAGPADIKISFCVKVSEIHWVKRAQGEKPSDFINNEVLVGISNMVDGDWTALAAALGFQPSQITKMSTDQRASVSKDICHHMLSLWYKQTALASKKARVLRAALKKINRGDIVEWLETHESAYKTHLSDSTQEAKMIKAFHAAIRHNKLCDTWLHLANSLSIPQEEITLIDCGAPRTNCEKAFLVMMKWWEQNPGSTLRSLQEALLKAGFPLVAKKVLITQ